MIAIALLGSSARAIWRGTRGSIRDEASGERWPTCSAPSQNLSMFLIAKQGSRFLTEPDARNVISSRLPYECASSLCEIKRRLRSGFSSARIKRSSSQSITTWIVIGRKHVLTRKRPLNNSGKRSATRAGSGAQNLSLVADRSFNKRSVTGDGNDCDKAISRQG